MAKNTGLQATLGNTAANKPGDHGGIAIVPPSIPDAPAQGSNGNPGTQLPWEGADATVIGANSALPALTHLGTAGGGHA